MKQCPKCGKQYDESWKICVKCNVFLDNEDRLTQLENQAKQILKEVKEIKEGKQTIKQEVKKEEVKKAEPKPVKTKKSQVSDEDTETKIGKYLLNKLGIASLVIGVAFFVAYTFQYLSPVFKIFVGYAIGVSLLLFGTRIEKNDKFKWYGRSLIAGGWALVYFVTFAMYHIQATKIIQNQVLDLVLLAVIVTGMIGHLLKYRSETVVGMVLFLGYFTAGISQVTYFTLIYITLLAVIAIALSYKMKWYELPLFSMIATYLTYFYWTKPQIYSASVRSSISPDKFWLAFGFLAIFWVTYNILPFMARVLDEKPKKLVIGSTFLNAICFGVLGGIAFHGYNPDLCFNFFIVSALCIAGVSMLSKYVVTKEHLFTPYVVIAIAYLTSSLPFKLDREWVNVIWLLEIPVLIYLGLHLRSGFYRVLGWALGLVMLVKMLNLLDVTTMKMTVLGMELPTHVFVVTIGIISYYVTKILFKKKESTIKMQAEIIASNATLYSATLLYGLLTLMEMPEQFVTVSWALGAFLLFGIGFFLRDKYFRYAGMLMTLSAVLRIVFIDLAELELIYRILVFMCFGVVLMIVSYFYTKGGFGLKSVEK